MPVRLGAFAAFLAASAAENDVFPKKKRDEDDLLRFFLLRFSLKELSKKPANVNSRMTHRICCRYGTRANSVTCIHECSLNGWPAYGWEKPRYSFRKRCFAHTKSDSPGLKTRLSPAKTRFLPVNPPDVAAQNEVSPGLEKLTRGPNQEWMVKRGFSR